MLPQKPPNRWSLRSGYFDYTHHDPWREGTYTSMMGLNASPAPSPPSPAPSPPITIYGQVGKTGSKHPPEDPSDTPDEDDEPTPVPRAPQTQGWGEILSRLLAAGADALAQRQQAKAQEAQATAHAQALQQQQQRMRQQQQVARVNAEQFRLGRVAGPSPKQQSRFPAQSLPPASPASPAMGLGRPPRSNILPQGNPGQRGASAANASQLPPQAFPPGSIPPGYAHNTNHQPLWSPSTQDIARRNYPHGSRGDFFRDVAHQQAGHTAEDFRHTDVRRHQERASAQAQEDLRQYQQYLDNYLLGSIHTLLDPQAPLWQKALALAPFAPARLIPRPIAMVVGKSDDALITLQKAGLNPAQIANYRRFVREVIKNRPLTTTVHNLPNGGKFFQAAIPGRTPGYYAVYQKAVSSTGKTLYFGKMSFSKDKRFIHGNIKAPITSPYIFDENEYRNVLEIFIIRGTR